MNRRLDSSAWISVNSAFSGWLFVIVGCMLMLFPGGARSEGIQLGILTEFPPYVYQESPAKQQAKPQQGADQDYYISSLPLAVGLGDRWDVVLAWQGIDGPDGYARVRRVVEEHRRQGLHVAIRLVESGSVYAEMQSSGSGAGAPKEYAEWVSGIASALAGKVDFYLVGNEPEAGVTKNYGWLSKADNKINVDYSMYRNLELLAGNAIHKADPQAQVGNSGFSDKTLALAYAYAVYQKQGIGAAQEAWRKWKAISGDSVEGRVGLWRLLNSDESVRKITFLNQAIDDPAGTDLFQVHYYGGWRAIPELMSWLQQRMKAAGHVRPIVACEVGYRVAVSRARDEKGRSYLKPDLSRYSLSEHASAMVKSFVLLAGTGIDRLLYWELRVRRPRGMVAPLLGWEDDGSGKGPVAESFRFLADMLNDEQHSAGKLEPRAGLWERRFIGARDVSVVWSDEPMQIMLTPGVKEVYDLRGSPVHHGPDLSLTTEPLYILWGDSG
jgi:hypothetical protein